MTVTMAKEISNFMFVNNIHTAHVMGGEFFLNVKWKGILKALCAKAGLRLATNGDWAGNRRMSNDIIDFLSHHQGINVALSDDRWHTSIHTDEAESILSNAGVIYEREKPAYLIPNALIPVGRAEVIVFGASTLSSIWCSNKRFHVLIDEVGDIYKCPVGSSWRFSNIKNHMNGKFSDELQKFLKKFDSASINNCRQCCRIWSRTQRKVKKPNPV
jgi:hypothetical protein